MNKVVNNNLIKIAQNFKENIFFLHTCMYGNMLIVLLGHKLYILELK